MLGPQILLFADGEVHLDGIDLRNRSQVGVGSDQVAHLDFRNAGDTVHQRSNLRPAEIEFGAFDRRLADATAASAASLAWISVSSCALGIAFCSASGVSRSTSRALFAQLGFCLGKFSLGAVESRLERPWVNLEQHLTLTELPNLPYSPG